MPSKKSATTKAKSKEPLKIKGAGYHLDKPPSSTPGKNEKKKSRLKRPSNKVLIKG